MTRLVYRREARFDLEQIKRYYDDISPQTSERVYEDIRDTLLRLKLFPSSGRRLEGRVERRIVTPKYRYVITYMFETDKIDVIGVFRFQDRQV